MSEKKEIQSQKVQTSTWVKTELLRWIGLTLIIMGAAIIFASYVYVPLNVWHGQAWNPLTWTWNFSHAYKNGWLGIIPLVAGAVIYGATKIMKPGAKEQR